MAVVSVTRLHLRSLRFLPGFLIWTYRSARQLKHARGYQGGWLGNELPRGFWTATVWDSLDSMRAFRNGSPHLEAMKKLLNWCDEASYAHWEQEGFAPPDGETAFGRLRQEGKVSKVLYPSSRHSAGKTTADAPPQVGRPIARKG